MITLQKYLEQTNRRVADLARDFNVVHCVARRWVNGEVMPSRQTIEKIYEWSGGQVEPNDFYNINETEIEKDNENASMDMGN